MEKLAVILTRNDGFTVFIGMFLESVAKEIISVFEARQEEFITLQSEHMTDDWGPWQKKEEPSEEDEAAYRRMGEISWARDSYSISAQKPLEREKFPEEVKKILLSREGQ